MIRFASACCHEVGRSVSLGSKIEDVRSTGKKRVTSTSATTRSQKSNPRENEGTYRSTARRGGVYCCKVGMRQFRALWFNPGS